MSASTHEFRVMTSGAFTAAHLALIPQLERLTKKSIVTVTTSVGTGDTSIPNRLKRGEIADIVIVADTLLRQLIDEGLVRAEGCQTVARSVIGMAVRAGAPKPDISTPDALRKTLLAAKSVSIPDSARGAAAGASFEETLKKLGIVEQMKATLRRVQGGANAMAVLAKGEVELGLTFLSEIHDPGVEVVGVLPREISTPTALVGYVSVHSKSPDAAKALLAYLSSPEVAGVYQSLGMQPGR